MNIIEALNKLKGNPNIAIKCGDITYIKRDRMGIPYKCIKKNEFYREETFLPLDTITSLEEVLSNDWEVVE
jgi:hypothetical protein